MTDSGDFAGPRFWMRKCGVLVIGLAVLIVLLYGNSLNNSWHFDDYKNIVGNPNVHLSHFSWEGIGKSFQGIPGESIRRPLSYFTFALNYHAGKLDVTGYHAVNILIHYLAALFLFLFLVELLKLPLLHKEYGERAYAIAILSAVLWSVNPVQVTGVTYIVQRMTSLSALFYVMAMFFYVKARTGEYPKRRLAYGLLCAIAALASLAAKEIGAMLPVCLFILELLLIQGVHRQSLKKPLIFFVLPFALLVAAGFYFTNFSALLGGYSQRPFTLEERLLTEPRIVLFYISLLLCPAISRLTLLHDVELSTSLFQPWTTGPALVLIFAGIILAVWLAKRKPLISFCLFFFFINHIIESTFLPLELIYEHRNYLPSMLFFTPPAIFMVFLHDRLVDRHLLRRAFILVFCLVLVVQGLAVMARNNIFKDELSLWADNVNKYPNLQRPHHNLALAYLSLGRLSEGRDELIKALQAKDVSRTYNKTHTWFYLGQYHRMVNNDEEALKNFQQATKIAYFNHEALHALAEVMLKRDDPGKAEDYITKALTFKPDEGSYHLTYSSILLKKGWPDAAIKEAERALLYKGDPFRANFQMAKAYELKNDPVSAAYYQKRAEGMEP